MNWIYDQRTEHSRLMVGYDRYGVRIRQWTDDFGDEDGILDGNYYVQDGFFSWDTFRNRERSYSRDNGSGRMQDRIIHGAISLLGYYGAPNGDAGPVGSLDEYLDSWTVREAEVKA